MLGYSVAGSMRLLDGRVKRDKVRRESAEEMGDRDITRRQWLVVLTFRKVFRD